LIGISIGIADDEHLRTARASVRRQPDAAVVAVTDAKSFADTMDAGRDLGMRYRVAIDSSEQKQPKGRFECDQGQRDSARRRKDATESAMAQP
jgi:hypothetical protein